MPPTPSRSLSRYWPSLHQGVADLPLADLPPADERGAETIAYASNFTPEAFEAGRSGVRAAGGAGPAGVEGGSGSEVGQAGVREDLRRGASAPGQGGETGRAGA